MLKKKQVELTPEVKIEVVNNEVLKQQEQFRAMLVVSEVARQTREEAIEELQKEVASLMAQVRAKNNAIEKAFYQNEADLAFEKRIAEFIG